MNIISEETEGSQMGEALAAVSGASPYQPKDLSDSIKDIVILVCNYCEKPTIRKQTKMKVVNGLIGMLKETNGFLSYYIEDLKQARCIEPFCLSSKQDDDHHLFWTFIEKLCEEIRDEEAYPILKCLIAQFNSLLAEAEIAKDSNPNIEIIDAIEGHAISTDNYAIVKGARNIDNAYLFINYLMREDVSRKIVEEYPYVSPININQVSKMSINSIFYNGYYVKNIGSSIKNYDKLWADVK